MANTPRDEEKPLRIALVVVGNEVLSGDTLDTNGHFFASRLAELGHELRAGEFVLLGSLTGLQWLDQPAKAETEIVGLGKVTLALT